MIKALKTSWRSLVLVVRALRALSQPTLIDICRTTERQYHAHNEVAHEYRYGRLRRLINTMARHGVVTCLGILAIYGLAVLVVLQIEKLPFSLIRSDIADLYRDYFNIDIALLAAQVTLIGLVYPIVIALVSILFDTRTSLGGRLSIFLAETMALPTGASALLLCGVIAVQLPVLNQLSLRVIATLTVLNLMWFVVNLAGLGLVFLANALRYIYPKNRLEFQKKYTVNISWPLQLRRLIAVNRHVGAIEYGFLTGKQEKASADQRAPSVSVNPFFRDHGNPAVTTRLSGKKDLVDVRFALLDLVARDWLENMKAVKAGRDIRHAPQLTFTPLYGESYTGTVDLARTELSPPLTFTQKMLISWAFKFGRLPRPTNILGTEVLVTEAIADLVSLIEGRRAQEFREQLDDLTDHHVFLFRMAELPDETGVQYSFVDLQGVTPWSLGYEWATEYRDLFARAVQELEHEPEYFRRCAYVASKLFNAAARSSPPSSLSTIGFLSFYLFVRLLDWALMMHRSSDTGTTVVGDKAFHLKPKQKLIYETAWRDFIGGWEQLPYAFFRNKDAQKRDWAYLGAVFVPVRTHLIDTAMMVAKCAHAGDQMGVDWSTDLLLRWYAQAHRAWGDADLFGGRRTLVTALLTTDVLKMSWAEVSALGVSRLTGDAAREQVVYSVIALNTWVDMQTTLISVLLFWIAPHQIDSAPAIAARKLIHHEFHDGASVLGEQSAYASVSDLLESLLRVSSGEEYGKGYGAEIAGLVHKLKDSVRAPLVAQRIYTGFGNEGIDRFAHQHTLMLLALVPIVAVGAPVRLGTRVSNLLRQLTTSDDIVSRRLTAYLQSLEKAVAALEAATHAALAGMLRRDADLTQFESWRSSLAAFLAACRESIAREREDRIRAAPIDQTRLRALEAAASRLAFQKAEAAFPITLFADIEFVHEPLKSHTFAVGTDRGSYTTPPMSDVNPAGEESWWTNTMRDWVAHLTLLDVLAILPHTEVHGDTPEMWWSAVQAAAAGITAAGHKPILIVANLAYPEWLGNWTFTYQLPDQAPRPDDMQVGKDPALTGTHGYLVSLNDIPVYRGPVGTEASIVMAASALKSLGITQYPTGQPIAITFRDDPDGDIWKGIVDATFARRLTIEGPGYVKVRYAAPTPENVA